MSKKSLIEFVLEKVENSIGAMLNWDREWK